MRVYLNPGLLSGHFCLLQKVSNPLESAETWYLEHYFRADYLKNTYLYLLEQVVVQQFIDPNK